MPRAPWKSIVVGEIIGPICLAIVFVVCYLFVKSFAVGGVVEPGLLRIAIIALGPIVWNMAMLTLLFLISLFLGPCVSHLTSSPAPAHISSTRTPTPLVLPWLPWHTFPPSLV